MEFVGVVEFMELGVCGAEEFGGKMEHPQTRSGAVSRAEQAEWQKYYSFVP